MVPDARGTLLAALRQQLPAIVHEADGRAVLVPRNEYELADAVRLAGEIGAELAPPGAPRNGGSRALAIDLQRMGAVLGFDEGSRILHVQGGCSLATIERELGGRGLTLGVREVALELDAGTWLAVGAPGARDPADDPVDHLVAGLGAVLPDGTVMHVRPAPRRAVGPDLAGAMIGARGRLGVITSVHFAARARTHVRVVSFEMPSRETAGHALAWIRGIGVRPLRAEVNDHVLRLELAADGPLAGAALAAVERTVAERGGVPLARASEAAVGPLPMATPGPTLEMLARSLDPRGVLEGTP